MNVNNLIKKLENKVEKQDYEDTLTQINGEFEAFHHQMNFLKIEFEKILKLLDKKQSNYMP